jgi:hypothetical protein
MAWTGSARPHGIRREPSSRLTSRLAGPRGGGGPQCCSERERPSERLLREKLGGFDEECGFAPPAHPRQRNPLTPASESLFCAPRSPPHPPHVCSPLPARA